MNHSSPLARMIYSFSLLLGFFCATISHAQTNNWLPTSGTNAWTDATNWSLQTVPNESGAIVLFGAAQTVSLSQAVTVSSILTTNSSGSVVIGDANDLADILLMDAGTNSPVINVGSGSSPQLFMYADLEGTNGFTKSGGGILNLRYNPNDQFIDGPLIMAAGTLIVRYNGHFGGTLSGFTNSIIFSGNSTIQHYSSPSALEIPASRSIVINSGVTGTFQNATNTGLIFNCPITGAGNLQLTATNGSYTLNAVNTYTGNTTVNNGAKLVLGSGANISTNNLLVTGTTAGTSIDLGGNAQAIGNLSNTVSVTSTMVITNGALNLYGTNNQVLGSQPDGSVIDLSGLAGFSFNNSTRNFSFQPGTNATGSTTNTLNLSSSSNKIVANQIQLGASAGGGTSNAAIVKMGQNNQFFATTIILGGFNASGYLNGLTNVNPNLVLRGTNGLDAVGTLKIGETSSGTRAGWGDLNVGNGSIDALITSLSVGRHTAGSGNAETSSLSFSNGSVVSENAILAEKSGTGTPTITGTVNQGGGIFEVGTLTLGVGSLTNALPVLKPTFNLAGGTLKAASIVAGAGSSGTNFATSSERRIYWSGGTIRPRNNGTNLTISGTSGAGGTLDILALGSGLKTLTADGSNSVILSGGTWLSANGGDLRIDPGEGGTFTTTGAFTVGSAPFANTPAPFSAPLNASITIVSGTNNITTATRIFGIGDRTNAGVTNSFNVTGGTVNVALTVNRMLVGNKSIGEVNVTGGLLGITGNQGIYVGGDPSFGGNGAQGSWTISGGTVNLGGTGVFVLGQNSATTSNVTSNSIGTLNLRGGNFITARAITTGANTNGTSSTGIVRFNGGKLTAGTNLPVLMNVTTAEIQSGGGTIDTVGFDVTNSQSLSGAGKLTKLGIGTLTLSGANSYAGDTDVNAGALSLLGTVASPSINVASGAALVLSTAPLGLITNNIVFATGAKIRVNGTPVGSSVNLLTTYGTISGSPELETPIPGYTLVTSSTAITLLAAGDTTPPSITLRGDNPMTISLGASFTDPGADVTDNVDLTRLVYGAGTVNVNQAGNYSLTYTASDAANNAASPIIRTVEVTRGSPTLSGISATPIAAGQAFADSTLSGTAVYNGGNVAGTWVFAAGQTLSGSGNYNVVFNPTDTSNYNPVNGSVNLTVNPPNSGGSNFSSWGGGGPTNSELVGKYAIGGASNSSSAAEKPVVTVDSNTLSLSAIVRTNDAKLNVVGEAGGSLTNWSTNGISVTASTNTNGVPDGHQRRVFSVDRTNAPTKQFLRLRATLEL